MKISLFWGFMIKRLSILILMAGLIAPSLANAQGFCSDSDQESLDICIEDATFECLDAFPDCEDNSAGSAADAIIEHIEISCCEKDNAGKITACLNSAMASLKKAGKIMPPDMRDEIKLELKDLITEVRSSGGCFGDEE